MAFNERPAVPRSRDDAFNDLLVELSHKMSEVNVQELSVVGGLRLNSGYRAPPPTALDVLLGLRNQGEFSPHCCARLSGHLRRIYRCDLADLVRDYMHVYATVPDADPPPEKRHTPIQERRSDPGVIPLKRSATDPPSLSFHSVAARDDSRAEHEMSSDLMTPLRQNTQGETMEGDSEHQTITSSSYACEQSTHSSYPGDQSQPSYGSFRPNSHTRLHGSQETCSRLSTISRDSLLCSLSSQQGSQASPRIAIDIHIGPLSDELLHSSLSLSSESADSRSQPKSRRQSLPDLHSLSRHRSKEGLCDAHEWSMRYATLHEKAEEDVISISNDERREKCHMTKLRQSNNSPAQSVRSAAISSDDGSPRPTQSPKTDSKPQVSGRHKSQLQETRHKPEADTDETIPGSLSLQSFGSPKEGGKWKRFLHLSGRKAKRSRELTTQCTWTIERNQLVNNIWNPKERLSYIKYHKPVAIDMEYGDLNPYISLFLYPYGLFADQNKSVTLLVKVILPDDCPPVPATASFNFSWDIRTKEAGAGQGKVFESSKKPVKVPFDKGMVYIRKFFPHTTLQKYDCNEYEIQLRTSYWSQTTACDVATVQDPGTTRKYLEERPTMPMLLSFKTRDGELNLAQIVGDDYPSFGQFLLHDDTGAVCKSIANNGSDTTSINHDILGLWLQGKGKLPVQWSTIIEVLRGIEMNALATALEQNLPLNTCMYDC